jgi:putative FmdB family regulatory protein
MPTYDYSCEACGHHLEHFQSMTSRRLRTCPECKKKALVRHVGSGAGLIFKGSGFYETDYKRSGSKPGSTSSSESSGESSKQGAKEGGKGASGTSAKDSGSD